MESKPVLSKITIYPIKSLDGVVLKSAVITEGGCLLHDREFAMSDNEANLINGKANPLIHSLRSSFDLENEIISLRKAQDTSWTHFHLKKEKSSIESYLSDHLGIRVSLLRNTTGRFLDIPDISGVTVASTSTLQEVSTWFNLDIDETRRRFRATLEIENVTAFWEDHLFLKQGRGIEFKVGDVTMFGMQPRARCVVPTRHPETGKVTHAFPKSFAKRRASTVPAWSTLKEYGHYYYLAVDCYIPATEIGKVIESENEVKIIGEKVFC